MRPSVAKAEDTVKAISTEVDIISLPKGLAAKAGCCLQEWKQAVAYRNGSRLSRDMDVT
jgi:hypothetical protein